MVASKIYDTLVDCIKRGAHVDLTLLSEERISRFRAHDIVAPKGIQLLPNADEAKVRGIVWPDRGPRYDRSIRLQEIKEVQNEDLLPYIPEPAFFVRNPVPRDWVQVHVATNPPKYLG